MKHALRAELTLVLALCLFSFLTFCLVLLEGVRSYYLQMRAQRAADLSAFSVLSEYQPELLKHYGMFFLNLDYQKGEEDLKLLSGKAEYYLSENAEGLQTQNLEFDHITRSTDGVGDSFFRQAVHVQKEKTGIALFEEVFLENQEMFQEDSSAALEKEVEETYEEAETIVDEYLEELRKEQEEEKVKTEEETEEEEVPFEFPVIELPEVSFPSIDSLSGAVFGDLSKISPKLLSDSETIGQRTMREGSGVKASRSLFDWQLFYCYLLEHCNYYGAEDNEISKEVLEYQLEYIVAGKASDRENLENIMWRIFLLRAAGCYVRDRLDAAKQAEAAAEAAIICSVIASPELIELVKELILMKAALEDGIEETERIFQGEKLPIYDGKVPGSFRIGYKEYLYLFLNLTAEEDKIYRSMDIVEREVRVMSGYEEFSMDCCTDAFRMKWNYRFEGVDSPLVFGGRNRYQRRLIKEIYYER